MPTLSSHACFRCRKVFKKPHQYSITPTVRLCPHCGGQMVGMGYKFRAPKAHDLKEWARIEKALRQGLDYARPTIRKQKPEPKLDPKFRIAPGTYGKRRRKKAV